MVLFLRRWLFTPFRECIVVGACMGALAFGFCRYALAGDAPEKITAKVNQPFTITLPVQLGTGVSWAFVDLQAFDIISRNVVPESSMPGSTAEQIVTLVPNKKGDFIVNVRLGRPNSETYEQRNFHIHVE
jgi:hypothetical protein